MKMVRACTALGTLVLCWGVLSPANAQVQRPSLITEPSKNEPTVAPNNQYAFEIKCTSIGELRDPSDFFVSRNRALFVLIAPNAPAGTDKIPADALAAVQVYTIGKDKDTKQPIVADDRGCEKSFLVNGSKSVGVVITDNRIDNFSDSQFGAILAGGLGLISPLFSLFMGQSLPAAIAGKVTNIGTVQTTIQNILTALGRGQNYTRELRNLRTGTYKLHTEYADVAITIRAVPSIVLDKNPAFRDDLKAQINTATIKLDGTKIETSCRGARYDISSLGFRSPTDLAFGLVHLSGHAGFNKKDTISCLTPEYAKVAAAAPDQFWVGFLGEFKIMPADLVPAPKGQPTWEDIEATIDKLVVALARYARNDPPPKIAVDTLTKLLAAQVAIVDNTTSLAISDESAPVDRFAAVRRLKDKGYIRFGCYAATNNDTTDQRVDGATSMFLVFKAPSDAVKTSLDSALAVRPQFKDGVVTTLAISDNRAWIVATLKVRGYDCNGFSVEKPAGGGAVAVAIKQ